MNMDFQNVQINRTFLYIALFFFTGFLIVYFGGSFSEERAFDIPDMPIALNQGPLHIDVSGSKVAYFDYSPAFPHLTVLLLHGMRYSKENWKTLGTLDTLLQNGYRAIAVDLPGYGDSEPILELSHEQFIRQFIAKVDAESTVIVSPSMSGGFAIPVVFSEPALLSGWVPVAPVSITSHKLSEYQALRLPVLAVYGENDNQFRNQVEEYLGAIPEVTLKMIPGGSHPCYLDNPDLWHETLIKFLSGIK